RVPVATVDLQPCLVGHRGAAYDLPGTTRAYTHTHQPGNSVAAKLGRVSRMDRSGGDDSDFGLALLRQLQAEGFGVFQLAAAPEPQEKHPDDEAVDQFAAAMKAKLAAAREKGRGGWDDPEQCTVECLAES